MPDVVNLSAAKNIGDLFRHETNYLFNIKPPQRRFKWENNELRQFWRDIKDAQSRENIDYFLGPILILHDKTIGGRVSYSVIDGQQRLTTLILFLAILRDRCNFYSMPRVGPLHRLVVRLDIDDQFETLVVNPQSPDLENLKKYVSEVGSTDDPPKPPNQHSDLVYRGLIELKRVVLEAEEKEADPKVFLTDLSNFVLNKVTLLPIDVGTEDQGILIFDTANTRGKRLSQAEKVRAGLVLKFRTNYERKENFFKNWVSSGMTLETNELPIDEMTDYLHAVWGAFVGYNTKQNLGKNIVEGLEDGGVPDPDEFIDAIQKYANSYCVIVKPEKSSVDTELKATLNDLPRIRFSQANGFLMMAYHHEPKLFNQALEAAISLQVRNISFGPLDPNTYQSDWPRWSQLARTGALKRAVQEIEDRLRSDVDFKNDFKNFEKVESNLARHVIRKIDLAMHPYSGVSTVKCDVEHILPQDVVRQLKDGDKVLSKNVAQWITDIGEPVPNTEGSKKDLSAKLEPYLHRIGNQVLLHQHPNRANKNAPFHIKRPSFKAMKITMTQKIGDASEWNLNSITTRQNELVDAAVAAWPSKFKV